MRGVLAGLVLTTTATVAAAQGPVEIDRSLSRVNNVAIMTSDVRQARILRVLTPAPTSDDAILTALENRLLMLSEATRSAVAEPRFRIGRAPQSGGTDGACPGRPAQSWHDIRAGPAEGFPGRRL
jgi:hypothetical protein